MSEDPASMSTEGSREAGHGPRVRAGWVIFAVVAILVVALAAGWALSASRSDGSGQSEQAMTAGDSDRAGADAGAGTGAGAGSIQRIADLADLPAGPVEHVQVAYFHRAQRCHSCIEAERLTRKTLDTFFAEDLERGDISLLVLDVEASENTELVQVYDAWTSSLYLGVTKGGVLHVYSVADMWLGIGDEARFAESLRSKLEAIFRSA